jgi:hypothetical protein
MIRLGVRTLPPLLLLALVAACDPGDVSNGLTTGGDDDGSGPPIPSCNGPLGAPQPTDGLTECCDLGGHSHCLPDATIPDSFKQYTEACTGGGLCVPDPFIITGGVYQPPACKSLNGADGVCLSACIPQVRQYEAILPTEGCGPAERCVPCISPIDGSNTGACDIKGTCDDGTGTNPPPPSDGDDPSTCVHEGNPVINPSALTPCGDGAHCLQAALVPPDFKDRLGNCTDATMKCVPDIFLETGGKFIPATCRSVNDAEGRCLNKVIPEVAAQAALLPAATCGAGELCVPCYNPIDSTDTGACKLSCDTGPTEPAKPLAACCSGAAKCVPDAAVPSTLTSNLDQDSCVDMQLCVPNDLLAFQQGTGPAPRACTANGFLIGQYTGVCLSDCLKFGLQGIVLARGDCDQDFKCAPCVNPLSGQPTGAPGCP